MVTSSDLPNYYVHYLMSTGEVELENVPLRKDALRNLDIPLHIVSGFVGRVKLQIPVSRMRSEPWVVVFENLYGVAAPIKLSEVTTLIICLLYRFNLYNIFTNVLTFLDQNLCLFLY